MLEMGPPVPAPTPPLTLLQRQGVPTGHVQTADL